MADTQVQSTADYTMAPLRFLIGGIGGAGLTRFGATFPQPLLAELGGNLMALRDRVVPYVDIADTDALIGLLTTMKLDPEERSRVLGYPVSTLVIDTLDRLEAMAGAAGQEMTSWMQALCSLPVHVVLLCHLTHHRGRLDLALANGFADVVSSYVDVSAALGARSIHEAGSAGGFCDVRQAFLLVEPDTLRPWISDHTGAFPAEVLVNFDLDGWELVDRAKTVLSGDRAVPPTAADNAMGSLGPAPVPTESGPGPVLAAPAPTMATPVEADPPGLPNCDKCGKPIERQADVTLSQVRRLGDLCGTCGEAAYRASAGLPAAARAASRAASAPPAVPAAAPAAPAAEQQAVVPHGVPVGRIPPPSDDALRDFLG